MTSQTSNVRQVTTFGPVKQWLNGGSPFAPGAIFAGVKNDPRYAEFMRASFFPTWRNHIEDPAYKKYGFDTLTRGTAWPGTAMNPTSLPHSASRKTKKMSKLWWKCAEHTWDHMFKNFWMYKDRPVKLRPDANEGPPTMTTDVRERVKNAIYQYEHADEIFDCVERRDMTTLREKYGIYPIARVLPRAQGDSANLKFENNRLVGVTPSKPRFSWDGEQLIEASKELDPEYAPFLAKRIRTVVGVSGRLNYIPIKVANMMLQACFDSCPALHQGDPLRAIQLANEIAPPSEFIFRSGDCVEFDHSATLEEILFFFNRLRTLGVRQGCIDLCLMSVNPPYMARALYRDKHDGCHFKGSLDNPLDLLFFEPYGLGSGSAFTTVFARWKKATDDMATACSIGKLECTVAGAAQLLSFNLTKAGLYVQSGDDFGWWLRRNDASLAEKLEAAQERENPNLKWSFDPVDTSAYLSTCVSRSDTPGSNAWVGIPNLGSAWFNTWSPERYIHPFAATDQDSISPSFLAAYYGLAGKADDKFVRMFKKLPFYGWKMKNERMSKLHPLWDTFVDINMRLLYDFGYRNVEPLLRQLTSFEERYIDSLGIEVKNAADSDFLADPNVIYWKWSPVEISDSILKKFFASIGPEYQQSLNRAMCA